MVIKNLKARITEDHQLQVNDPEELLDLQPGEVKITVKGNHAAQAEIDQTATWTTEELREALTFHPVPANQMVIEPWDGEPATEDSLASVLERRRKKREARRWQRD